MTDLSKLRELAERAAADAPGWYTANELINFMEVVDAEVVAAASPDAVLALLDRLEAAEAKLAKVRELHSKHENTIHATPEWVCSHRNCVDDAGDQSAWPCATIRALDGEDNAEHG
ncbi:hypothetical protein MUN77_01555 [Leucobacter allii]|uniref:hypothetical protein n=1 Tax=Leucobacter allii TaxID=2932247 RepID=UPI001FD623E3|nr:hypothetical protein [Leucobacter allii]UOR02045.1 hypothetical protein MUN77_01555 [Leucobacter allii]